MPLDSIVKITSNGRILHYNKNDHLLVECPICNQEILPFWEPRYNGLRATCHVCGVNWPES